jgi:hypothetical protein
MRIRVKADSYEGYFADWTAYRPPPPGMHLRPGTVQRLHDHDDGESCYLVAGELAEAFTDLATRGEDEWATEVDDPALRSAVSERITADITLLDDDEDPADCGIPVHNRLRLRIRTTTSEGLFADLAAGREHPYRDQAFRPDGTVTKLHDHGGDESCYLIEGDWAEQIAGLHMPGASKSDAMLYRYMNARIEVIEGDEDPADCKVLTISKGLQAEMNLDDDEVREMQAAMRHYPHPNGDFWTADLYGDGREWLIFVLDEEVRGDPLTDSPFLEPDINEKLAERGVDGIVEVMERTESRAVVAVYGALKHELLAGWQRTDAMTDPATGAPRRFFYRFNDGVLDIAPNEPLDEHEWRRNAEEHGGTFTRIGSTRSGPPPEADDRPAYRITGQFADALYGAILRDAQPTLTVHFAMHEPRHARI